MTPNYFGVDLIPAPTNQAAMRLGDALGKMPVLGNPNLLKWGSVAVGAYGVFQAVARGRWGTGIALLAAGAALQWTGSAVAVAKLNPHVGGVGRNTVTEQPGNLDATRTGFVGLTTGDAAEWVFDGKGGRALIPAHSVIDRLLSNGDFHTQPA